jgi:hypothetical protein
VVVISVLLLGMEMLNLLKIFPIRLSPHQAAIMRYDFP